MSALAQLLFGIAAIITALFTGVTGFLAVTRGSPRQRQEAARGAIDRLLHNSDEDEDGDLHDAVTDLLEKMLEQRKDDDS